MRFPAPAVDRRDEEITGLESLLGAGRGRAVGDPDTVDDLVRGPLARVIAMRGRLDDESVTPSASVAARALVTSLARNGAGATSRAWSTERARAGQGRLRRRGLWSGPAIATRSGCSRSAWRVAVPGPARAAGGLHRVAGPEPAGVRPAGRAGARGARRWPTAQGHHIEVAYGDLTLEPWGGLESWAVGARSAC